MRRIEFPQWPEVLAQSGLPNRDKASFAITIRWYLSFCRRARVEVTVQSARDFVETVVREKQPPNWRLEQWKAALRWFFRTAKERESAEALPQSAGEPGQVWLPPKAANWPEWKTAFLTTLRRRRYSYRTEESYLVWLEQYARYLRTEDLRAQGEEQISGFLDALALNHRLSASSQRQALNALVFLYREVFGRELGDFSEYRRAPARTHLPVWLTQDEIERFFACLDEPSRLMAKVMYGGGLRLMELLRLRVKDLGLQEEIITVRGGKGDKDRFAPLAHCLLEPLQSHLQNVRRVFESDRAQDVAGVWLPDGLERKYPNAGQEWPWFWVWPEKGLSVDPRQGVLRRHHFLDRTFQVAIKVAAVKATSKPLRSTLM